MNFKVLLTRDSWNSNIHNVFLNIIVEDDEIILSLSDNKSKSITFEKEAFSSLFKCISVDAFSVKVPVKASTWHEIAIDTLQISKLDDSSIAFAIEEFDDEADCGYSLRELEFSATQFLLVSQTFGQMSDSTMADKKSREEIIANQEAIITINGHTVTSSMAMTFRVAMESFAGELSENGLGGDEMGQAISKGYLENIKQIRALMYQGK